MRIPDEDPFLAGLETESVAKLQQEFLQFIKELILQMRLAHDFPWLQAKEFEDVGIADCQPRRFFLSTLLRQFREFLFVA